MDPRGNATYFVYDESDRLVRMDDAFGRSVYFDYDGSDTKIACVRDAEVSWCP